MSDKQDRLKRAIVAGKIKNDGDLATFTIVEDFKEEIDSELKETKAEVFDALKTAQTQFIDAIKEVKGSEMSLDKVLSSIKGKDAVVDYPFLIKEVLSKIPKPKDGVSPVIDYKKLAEEAVAIMPKPKDGISPEVDYEFIIQSVETLIKIPEDGKDGSPDTGEQIIDKVNSDSSTKRISRDKVEGLYDLEQQLRIVSSQPSGVGGGASGIRDIRAGSNITVSKVNDIYTISSTASGGGGSWGSITGTLSDQTDLQSALDAKLSVAAAATTYLKLDQTTPQTVTGGMPIFDVGVHTPIVQAHTSAGLLIEAQGGTDVALFGAGGGSNTTFYGGVKLDSQTADRILSIDSSKNITALDTATYPSLTELSYVKGVTSAIQTQLNTKVSGSGVSGQISYWSGTSSQTGSANLLFNTQGTLDLKGDTTGYFRIYSSNSAGGYPYLAGFASRGTVASPTALTANGDYLLTLAGFGHNGTSYVGGASIVMRARGGTPSSTSMPGQILFYTTRTGATSSTLGGTLDSQGRWGLGNISDPLTNSQVQISQAQTYGLIINNGSTEYRVRSLASGIIEFDSTGGASVGFQFLDKVQVDNNVAADIALRVRGHASQSASLQEWQTSGGTVLASIGSGGLITNRLTTKQQQWEYDGSNYANITVGSTGDTTFALTGTSPTFTFSQRVLFTEGATFADAYNIIANQVFN